MDTDLELRPTRTFDLASYRRETTERYTLVDDPHHAWSTTRRFDRAAHESAASGLPPYVASNDASDRPASDLSQEDPHPIIVHAVDPDEARETAAAADYFDHRGRLESESGRLDVARALHERALVLRRGVFGEADPRLLQSFTLLGAIALRDCRLDQAQWLFDQAHAVALKRHGPDHPHTAMTLNNLGVLARRRHNADKAATHLMEALAIKLAAHGNDHLNVASTLVNLGNLARARRDPRVALHCFSRACLIFDAHAPDSPGHASALVGLARVHLNKGYEHYAVQMLERALAVRERHPVTPAQLAGVRLLLASAVEPHDPARARRLVAASLVTYETSDHPDPRHLEAMRAWLARFDHNHDLPRAS